jgi:4-hydroxy-tetrahydrodipicolinate synthase
MTLKLEWLQGCATALVTPFTNSGMVDEDRFCELVERQIQGGVKLLVPCGTTGESATLSEEEDQRIIRLAIETAKGRAHVIAGAGSNSTKSAVDYSVMSFELGADAVLVVSPYYNKPTQEGLFQHYSAIARAVDNRPVVLYNVPGRTASNITASTTIRLAREHENIVAIKEASGDMSQIMTIIRDRPSNFKVFSGDDAVTLGVLLLGGDGVISVISNEVPGEMSRLVNFALQGNLQEARRIHYRLLNLMETNFVESNPGPVKSALAMMGLIEENYRLPLVPLQPASREKLRQVLIELELIKETKNVAAHTD